MTFVVLFIIGLLFVGDYINFHARGCKYTFLRRLCYSIIFIGFTLLFNYFIVTESGSIAILLIGQAVYVAVTIFIWRINFYVKLHLICSLVICVCAWMIMVDATTGQESFITYACVFAILIAFFIRITCKRIEE
jgi:hypothetical protein